MLSRRSKVGASNHESDDVLPCLNLSMSQQPSAEEEPVAAVAAAVLEQVGPHNDWCAVSCCVLCPVLEAGTVVLKQATAVRCLFRTLSC